jgi:hypothetical protein
MRDKIENITDILLRIRNKDCKDIAGEFKSNVGKLISYVEELSKKMDMHSDTLTSR